MIFVSYVLKRLSGELQSFENNLRSLNDKRFPYLLIIEQQFKTINSEIYDGIANEYCMVWVFNSIPNKNLVYSLLIRFVSYS